MDERDQNKLSQPAQLPDEAEQASSEPSETSTAAPETPTESDEQPREFRGLYRFVRISVKTLDKIIIVGVLAIIVIILFGVKHNGYTVTFDPNGGTDVVSQELKYGEVAAEPDDPTREGYTFEGWYTDDGCTQLYDFDTKVENDLTLYAGWQAS